MVIKLSDYVTLDDPRLDLRSSWYIGTGDFATELKRYAALIREQAVTIQGRRYPIVDYNRLSHTKGSDGKYHAIYIQINFLNGEYYIGKVNRGRWKEVLLYQGSGVLFTKKYNKHSEEFARYYILVCDSAEETEKAEAEIVNADLLRDPFCLNKATGGGGGSQAPIAEERKKRQSEYMKAHPEKYQAMREAAKNMSQAEIEAQHQKTKKTMSQQKYRDMSRERIANWKEKHPEEYAEARAKNAESIRKKEVQEKRLSTLQKQAEEDPEKYNQRMEKWVECVQSESARKKRSVSFKKYLNEHPAEVKKRCAKAGLKRRRPILMMDPHTDEVLMEFSGLIEAEEWLLKQGKAKGVNPSSSICAARQQKVIPGHGVKRTAFGYKWRYKE